MLFWEKVTVTPTPLIDKPLDQSRLPSRFAQGRDLFAEPDSEDEALGLVELEDNRNAGIRAPELNPVDNSQTGLGSLSTIKRDFGDRQHGDLPDLDLDHHLQYHNDTRGDARYYTQTQLKPVTGLSVLDVEDGFGKGYRNATRFIDSSVGAGHAGFAIKLNSSGRINNNMLGSGSGFVSDAFKTIDCASGTDPVADSLTDTLQLLEGSTKITVTGDSAADSVTFDVVEANIDHGSIGGLSDDDHTQYLLADGTRNLTGNLLATGVTEIQFGVSTESISSPSAAVLDVEASGLLRLIINGAAKLQTTIAGISIGSQEAGRDYSLKFDGENSLCTITWKEDEARLDFDSKVKTSENFESAIVTGTAPLIVASTTVCTNLNADLLDGVQAAEFPLLAGRSGGQGGTFYGGTGSGDDFNISSTSNVTKGTFWIVDNGIKLGAGTSSDVVLTFNHSTTDGFLSWSGSNDYFKFTDDAFFNIAERVYFRNTDNSIYSPATGELKIATSTAAIDFTANLLTLTATTINFAGSATWSGDFTVDTDAFHVDSVNKRVGIGTASPLLGLDIQSTGTSMIQTRWSDTSTQGAGIVIQRARGTSDATKAVVQDNDKVSTLNFRGYSAAAGDYKTCAAIESFIDGTPDSGGDTTDMPGELRFSTVPEGSATIVNRMNIMSDGKIGIGNTAPSGFFHVDQNSAAAAIPVLTLDQADVGEEMIEFITTIGTGNAIEAVGAKTLTTTHFIKVTIPGGLTRYIPCGTIA